LPQVKIHRKLLEEAKDSKVDYIFYMWNLKKQQTGKYNEKSSRLTDKEIKLGIIVKRGKRRGAIQG